MKLDPFNIVTTALALMLLAYAFTGSKARAAEEDTNVMRTHMPTHYDRTVKTPDADLPGSAAKPATLALAVPVKHAGIGVPLNHCDESRRPRLTAWSSGFFVRAPFYGGLSGGLHARRFAQVIPGTPTRSSRRPDWRQCVGFSKPNHLEAVTMALTLQGRSAPTTPAQAAPKLASIHEAALIELHSAAHNAAILAKFYTARKNYPAATRKARQHLAALRQLAKLQTSATKGGLHHA